MNLGIDLKENKLNAVFLHQKSLKPTWCKQLHWKEKPSYSFLLQTILDFIQEAKNHTSVLDKIGIAIEGSYLEKNGTVAFSVISCLKQKNLKLDLEKKTNTKINIAGHSHCFALATAILEFTNKKSIVGVVLGKSFGAALILDNKITTMADFAHWSIALEGKNCYCGRRGCLEQYLSARAVKKNYNSIQSSSVQSPSIDGNFCDLKNFSPIQQIYEISLKKDKLAMKFIKEYIHYFYLAILTIINLYDPQVISFSGSQANLDILYPQTMKKIQKYYKGSLKTEFVRSQLKDGAAKGAALLPDHLI